MPANASFDKGAVVEEWLDRRFFRVVGLRVARAMPPAITADHVTFAALLIGLIAGRLMFYHNASLNALGVVLFIISDIFDSADGQLARMRGTSTRLGRMMDGVSDTLRFMNLYIQLIARLIVGGQVWWIAVAFGVAAGMAHSMQSAAVDFIKQLYLYIANGGGGELDLPEDLADMHASGLASRFQLRSYRRYVARQALLFPVSVEIVRQARVAGLTLALGQRWKALQTGVVRQTVWIAQNIRFAILAATVIPGWTAGFLWITLLPMTGILVVILMAHERRAATLIPAETSRLAEAA